jgi:hypothetical protein
MPIIWIKLHRFLGRKSEDGIQESEDRRPKTEVWEKNFAFKRKAKTLRAQK